MHCRNGDRNVESSIEQRSTVLAQITRASIVEQLENVLCYLAIVRVQLASSCSRFTITTSRFVLQQRLQTFDLLFLFLLFLFLLLLLSFSNRNWVSNLLILLTVDCAIAVALSDCCLIRCCSISVARYCRCRSKSLTIFCFVSICNGFPRSMSLQCYLQHCQYLFTNVFFSHCVNGFCGTLQFNSNRRWNDCLLFLFVVATRQYYGCICMLLWKQVGGIILRNWNLLLCSIRSLFEFVLSTVWFRFDMTNLIVLWNIDMLLLFQSIYLLVSFIFFRGEENNSQQV